MTNSADPDQLAFEEANWSGSTLFAKTGHVVFSKRRVKNLNINFFQVFDLASRSPVGQDSAAQNFRPVSYMRTSLNYFNPENQEIVLCFDIGAF